MKFIPLGIYGLHASARGASSSYLLQSDIGDVNILIDFGSGSGIELQKHIALDKINAIILTHLHYDHFSDIYPYIYFLEKSDISIPLYLPSDSDGLINAKCFNKIENPTKINIFGIQIEYIAVMHGKINSHMVKVRGDNKTLLYTSDFSDIEEYADIVQSVDIVFGDACAFGTGAPHVSIRELSENTPYNTKLFLTHLLYGSETDALNEALRYHADTYLARIGEEIVF